MLLPVCGTEGSPTPVVSAASLVYVCSKHCCLWSFHVVLGIPGISPQAMKATEEVLIAVHRAWEEVKVAALKGVTSESLW